jgi:predicted esterase
MATFDLRLGSTLVLLTFTDLDAAERVAGAVEAERGSLFQCEGVPIQIVSGARDAVVDVPLSEYAISVHSMTQADALEEIVGLDADMAEAMLAAELLNPRARGPRPKVVAALEENIRGAAE